MTAPAHFALILLPVTIAMATIGIYSMISTLVWGRLVFGIELEIGDPIAFALAVPATVVSIGALGFLLAVAFVRFRQAWALGNMLEYPVWLISGFLVPLTLFPAWVLPDLVGARADLGRQRDPRRGARRLAVRRHRARARCSAPATRWPGSCCSSERCAPRA